MTAFTNLPPAVQSPEWAGILAQWDATIADIQLQLNPTKFAVDYLTPATALESALDWRADISLWRGLWQMAWDVDTKRLLLAEQVALFQNRYSLVTLQRLFQIFKLDAIVEPISGFRLGVDTTPATLGVSLQSYRVSVPSFYRVGSLERQRVEELLKTFGLPVALPIFLRP
jgi:P2-related tail formation protein